MAQELALPVLPLDDTVLLPGMVVPIRLAGDDSAGDARAAVEAARAGADGSERPRVVLVPRLDGKYARVGTLGVIEQVGRLPRGELAAVVRGTARVRIGATLVNVFGSPCGSPRCGRKRALASPE